MHEALSCHLSVKPLLITGSQMTYQPGGYLIVIKLDHKKKHNTIIPTQPRVCIEHILLLARQP